MGMGIGDWLAIDEDLLVTNGNDITRQPTAGAAMNVIKSLIL